MYLNKTFILGHLTRDPELRAMPAGTKVASFDIATNRVWKDRNGAKQEAVDFHHIVVFGSQAEACGQWLKKGQQAFVEGRLQTRSYDNKDRIKVYKTEILADKVQFGSKPVKSTTTDAEPQDEVDNESGQVRAATPQASAKNTPKVGQTDIDYPENEIDPKDIPF